MPDTATRTGTQQDGTPPPMWSHQQRALEFIRDKEGAMLAMDMGTGKSRVAIEHIAATDSKTTLILAPLTVVDHVWEDQIRLHHGDGLEVMALGQAVPATDRKIREAERAMVRAAGRPLALITNYEATLQRRFREWAERMPWDMLVLDESHRIKAPTGATSLWLGEFAKGVPRRLALTGTPMPHSPLDLYGQFRALDTSIFGDSYHRFRDRYAMPGGRKYRRLEELAERMSEIAFQVRADDVLELPPVQHFQYRTAMNAEATRLYRQMEKQFLAMLEGLKTIHADNALSQLIRLQQLTSGYCQDRDGRVRRVDGGKSKALEEILDAIGSSEPVVVFARFHEDLDEAIRAAEAAGRIGWEYSGRRKQLREWKAQGGVLAAQSQTGSDGVDMTEARYCVYYSTGFSYGDHAQSLRRTHRPGQTRRVRYVHLVAAGTVDERIYQALQDKQDVVESILSSRTLRTQ